jgi:hypothetical protein
MDRSKSSMRGGGAMPADWSAGFSFDLGRKQLTLLGLPPASSPSSTAGVRRTRSLRRRLRMDLGSDADAVVRLSRLFVGFMGDGRGPSTGEGAKE